MDPQDDIVTAPVVARENSLTELQSSQIGSCERVEVVLEPSTPMRSPVLFIDTNPQDDQVVIEQIMSGTSQLVSGETSVLNYRMGMQLDGTLSHEKPLRILIVNNGTEIVRVDARLMGLEPRAKE